MSTASMAYADRPPLKEAIVSTNQVRLFGLNLDDIIKYFFAGNATISVVVLALITIFLFKEGAGFFPQHLDALTIYRKAGLEYVDHIRNQFDAHAMLGRGLSRLRQEQLKAYLASGLTAEETAARLTAFDAAQTKFDDAAVPLNDLMSELTDMVTTVKDNDKIAIEMAGAKAMYEKMGNKEEADAIIVEPVNYGVSAEALRATLPRYREVNATFATTLREAADGIPAFENAAINAKLTKFKGLVAKYIDTFPSVDAALASWQWDLPIPFYHAFTAFIMGQKWTTQSFWNDFYGVVPLFVGSLMISTLAVFLAVPFGVCAAIYVNQIATPAEQNLIKPYIEFISAIPSVVLGFFGIAVLGQSIRWLTEQPYMAWVPFFPISERLNIFTAGCLLALMAIPTIFSLAEDAIQNVPVHFKEASYALGATRLQTIIKIIVPAGLSGIVAAILLGFGRVIGETMVVLLVAGNRIRIPDFTQGLGAFFQPAHTMTGIIAQEMGEVVNGSLQYRALFIVGILLFFISLLVNYLAQIIVRRFKISIG